MKNHNNENSELCKLFDFLYAAMLEESHVETQNSKTPWKYFVEEESTDSSKEISPFLPFGFMVNHRNVIQNVYSYKFCSIKFTTPLVLGGHQNSHKFERSLKKRIQTFNNAWINYSNNYQGISLNTITTFHRGFNNMIQHAGLSNFYAWNLYGSLQHISEIVKCWGWSRHCESQSYYDWDWIWLWFRGRCC
jgi:hypothetical protein